jgi:hypothetical protein
VTVSRDIDATTAHEIFGLVTGAPAVGAVRRPSRPVKKRASGPRSVKSAPDGTKKTKRKTSLPGIVKDLSLKPSGKASFRQFVAEKKPQTHQQKQAVILYWLREFGSLPVGITTDHVNTCYVEAGWPRPANLSNGIQVTAKVKGWIDSSDMSDIKLTTRGEDQVTHDLPPQTPGK